MRKLSATVPPHLHPGCSSCTPNSQVGGFLAVIQTFRYYAVWWKTIQILLE